ncbi:transposase [Lactobacillus crispatus]|nr:transposase [Lactobacillus crispatus]
MNWLRRALSTLPICKPHNDRAVFMDGAKIEIDANRYAVAWRKAFEKYHDKRKGQAVEAYVRTGTII